MIDLEQELQFAKGFNCAECGQFIKTNISALNTEKLCFTHFRNGIGKKIFESGDLFI